MCDSGPILQYKPLLGQLATCVPLEVCVLQLSTHAKILAPPDMKQKVFSKILKNDSTTDLPLA